MNKAPMPQRLAPRTVCQVQSKPGLPLVGSRVTPGDGAGALVVAGAGVGTEVTGGGVGIGVGSSVVVLSARIKVMYLSGFLISALVSLLPNWPNRLSPVN